MPQQSCGLARYHTKQLTVLIISKNQRSPFLLLESIAASHKDKREVPAVPAWTGSHKAWQAA